MRLVLLFVGLLAYAAAQVTEEELLRMDEKPLIQDQTKWKELFECLMDRAPCGQWAKYKDVLLSVVSTKCGNCTPELKEIFERNIKKFIDKYPKDMAELIQKLSPKPE